jgi:flagellar FliL protein
MSEKEQKDAGATPGEQPPKSSGKRIILLAALGGILAGSAVGAFVVGPRFAGATQSQAEASEGPSEEGAAQHGKPVEAPANLHTVNNIVVNPAGSLGARFLMVSVGIVTPDGKVLEHLRKNEPVVRDLVIGVLERQTMESLAAPGARDSVRAQIAAALAPLAGKNVKLQILLPQFVVQ